MIFTSEPKVKTGDGVLVPGLNADIVEHYRIFEKAWRPDSFALKKKG